MEWPWLGLVSSTLTDETFSHSWLTAAKLRGLFLSRIPNAVMTGQWLADEERIVWANKAVQPPRGIDKYSLSPCTHTRIYAWTYVRTVITNSEQRLFVFFSASMTNEWERQKENKKVWFSSTERRHFLTWKRKKNGEAERGMERKKTRKFEWRVVSLINRIFMYRATWRAAQSFSRLSLVDNETKWSKRERSS